MHQANHTRTIMEKATHTFHHPHYAHNCAQAITHKWHKLFNRSDALVAQGKAWGGGRAPEGICGAMYAGLQLVADYQKKTFAEQFIQQAGHAQCKIIRRQGVTSCVQCVEIADLLLDHFHPKASH